MFRNDKLISPKQSLNVEICISKSSPKNTFVVNKQRFTKRYFWHITDEQIVKFNRLFMLKTIQQCHVERLAPAKSAKTEITKYARQTN